MTDTKNLKGKFVFLQKVINDPKTDSSYSDGEYIVVAQHGKTISAVKPVVGYGAHEIKSFLIGNYNVAEAYEAWDDLASFASALKEWSVPKGKPQWIDSVYSGAASTVRQIERILAEHKDEEPATKSPQTPREQALSTLTGLLAAKDDNVRLAAANMLLVHERP